MHACSTRRTAPPRRASRTIKSKSQKLKCIIYISRIEINIECANWNALARSKLLGAGERVCDRSYLGNKKSDLLRAPRAIDSGRHFTFFFCFFSKCSSQTTRPPKVSRAHTWKSKKKKKTHFRSVSSRELYSLARFPSSPVTRIFLSLSLSRRHKRAKEGRMSGITIWWAKKSRAAVHTAYYMNF